MIKGFHFGHFIVINPNRKATCNELSCCQWITSDIFLV